MFLAAEVFKTNQTGQNLFLPDGIFLERLLLGSRPAVRGLRVLAGRRLAQGAQGPCSPGTSQVTRGGCKRLGIGNSTCSCAQGEGRMGQDEGLQSVTRPEGQCRHQSPILCLLRLCYRLYHLRCHPSRAHSLPPNSSAPSCPAGLKASLWSPCSHFYTHSEILLSQWGLNWQASVKLAFPRTPAFY